MVNSFYNMNPDYADFMRESLTHDQAFQIWLDFNAYKISYDAGGQYGGEGIEAYVLKEHVESYGGTGDNGTFLGNPFTYATYASEPTADGVMYSWSGANEGLDGYLIDNVQILQDPNNLSYETYMAKFASQNSISGPIPYPYESCLLYTSDAADDMRV